MIEKIKSKLMDNKIAISAVVAVLFVISLFYYSGEVKNASIHKGVYVSGINLMNLNKDEAVNKISGIKAEELKTKQMNFALGEEEISISYEDLGYNVDIIGAVNEAYNIGRSGNVIADYFNIITPFIRKNIVLNEKFETENLDNSINYLLMKVFKEPVNADVVANESGFRVVKSETGRFLDPVSTRESILANISKNDVIPLQVTTSYPQITEEKFEGIDALLSEFSTDYSKSAEGRKANVALGSSFFNGLVVDANQSISFNQTVGSISAEAGFQKAGVLVNGELEQGVGGGICQVSTTLYNALILSDLQIDERHNHSRPIGYVNIATDAAVLEGYKDLKFTNNLAHKIYIKSIADGDNLTFQIFGHGADKNYDVEIFTELLGVEKPKTVTQYTSKLYEDEEEVESSGANGYSYATYKKVTNGENSTVTKISNSYYIPKNRVILVGTKEKATDKEILASSKNTDNSDKKSTKKSN